MKLRAPAIPLITVDPYFSVWSQTDVLTDSTTVHWTGKPNTLQGVVTVDGEAFRFMGEGENAALNQVHSDISALVTDYVFANDKIVLSLSFYTALLPEDLFRLSRPVSYLRASYESADGAAHHVTLRLTASEEFCINLKGSEAVETEAVDLQNAKAIRIGSKAQNMLTRDGDDLRIEWGYFYLAGAEDCVTETVNVADMACVTIEKSLAESENAYFTFAYDDIKSLVYFGEPVDAYWRKERLPFNTMLENALGESEGMLEECRTFGDALFDEAESAGGEKYAELCSLAYRQAVAGHKLALSPEGEALFISKECFSNGCAATVDVTYPSTPLFLRYNTELVKGMLRPIFRYTDTEEWEFDFAPHDAGTYPLVNGQKYGRGSGTRAEWLRCQMPVEECGNMIVTVANISLMDGNTDFADKYEDKLASWVRYLIEYGEDPANQLCTDDFAGHMAHNCNLSLKAIMGVMGYGLIMKMRGNTAAYAEYAAKAKAMAASWVERSANEDGSFRLAFDRPYTFSMKYNIVWDKLWGTRLFAPSVMYAEFASNFKHFNAYGMPLDNRKDYTKSDWLVWTAMLAPTKAEFEAYVAPLWQAYNVSPSRVPMTDWYDTVTSQMVGFRARTVQGGLFIKLLEERI